MSDGADFWDAGGPDTVKRGFEAAFAGETERVADGQRAAQTFSTILSARPYSIASLALR
jgi:hypothetical protein